MSKHIRFPLGHGRLCSVSFVECFISKNHPQIHSRQFEQIREPSPDLDLRSIEETQIDVFEHLFLVLLDGLAHTHHRKDYFLVIYCCHIIMIIVRNTY